MSLFIKENKAILFMHIPKCGGSSVVESFKKKGFSVHLEIRNLPPQKCLKASLQHQTPDTLKYIVEKDFLDAIFIIVRNPYERIRSEFNWEFRTTSINKRPDFNQWILKSLANALKKPNYADNHFRPAIDYIDEEMACRIFKLEDGLRLINEYYLEGQIIAKSAEPPKEKASELFQHKTPKNALNFSPESIEAINHFYYKDFLAFGYNMVNGEKITHKTCLANDEIEQIRTHKVILATEWRERTLQDLLSRLEIKINFLKSKVKKKNLKEADLIKNAHIAIEEKAYLCNLQCKNALLRLSRLSEKMNDSCKKDNELYRINVALEIIDNYQSQLKGKKR